MNSLFNYVFLKALFARSLKKFRTQSAFGFLSKIGSVKKFHRISKKQKKKKRSAYELFTLRVKTGLKAWQMGERCGEPTFSTLSQYSFVVL